MNKKQLVTTGIFLLLCLLVLASPSHLLSRTTSPAGNSLPEPSSPGMISCATDLRQSLHGYPIPAAFTFHAFDDPRQQPFLPAERDIPASPVAFLEEDLLSIGNISLSYFPVPRENTEQPGSMTDRDNEQDEPVNREIVKTSSFPHATDGLAVMAPLPEPVSEPRLLFLAGTALFLLASYRRKKRNF